MSKKAFDSIDDDATETTTYKGVYVIIDHFEQDGYWQAIDGHFNWKVRATTREKLQTLIEQEIDNR